MNTIQKGLLEICGKHIKATKILITDSVSTGMQIIESVVRSGTPVLNLRAITPKIAAQELMEPEFCKEGVVYLPQSAQTFLIEGICAEMSAKDDFYFRNEAIGDGIAAALSNSIHDLRMCGIRAEDLKTAHFLSPRKFSSFKSLLLRFEQLLTERRFADDALMLQKASAKLDTKKSAAAKIMYIIPAGVRFSPLERELIGRLPGEIVISTTDHACGIKTPKGAFEFPSKSVQPGAARDIERLSWLYNPAKAPRPAGDGSIKLFHAVGRRNEIKEVFRRMAEQGIAADDAEILCISADAYTPLIHAAACTLEIRVSFAEGLPALVSRPGRLAAGFLDWLSTGYRAADFRRLIESGNFDLNTTSLLHEYYLSSQIPLNKVGI